MRVFSVVVQEGQLVFLGTLEGTANVLRAIELRNGGSVIRPHAVCSNEDVCVEMYSGRDNPILFEVLRFIVKVDTITGLVFKFDRISGNLSSVLSFKRKTFFAAHVHNLGLDAEEILLCDCMHLFFNFPVVLGCYPDVITVALPEVVSSR